MKKLSIYTAVIFGLVLFVSGSVNAATDEIVIGCMYDITGTYSAMSKMEREGVDMAVSDINASGGLLGKQVRVIYEDNETKPEIAVRKAEQLILRDKVDFLVAPVGSNETLAVMQIVKKYNKILMVSISQSTAKPV